MSKVVNPTNTTHSFDFEPRFKQTTTVDLHLTNESDSKEYEVANNTQELKNNLIKITFDYTFKESDKYQIKILEGEKVIYRGKLFATEQETQDFVITQSYLEY